MKIKINDDAVKAAHASGKSYLTPEGFEIPDPTPMEIPAGITRPPTIQEMIQRTIRVQLSQAAAAEGKETWEEADDFDTGEDDPELRSRYELDDEVQGGSIREFIEETPDPRAKKADPAVESEEGEGVPKPTPKPTKSKPRAKAPAVEEPEEG